MDNDNSKIIASVISVAGLILYAYLIFFADISPEKQQYTVLAASLGVLYPLASLSNNMYYSWNSGKVWGVGIASACLIIIIGLITKTETTDGLIWDFFNSISSLGYRFFYLLILIIANIYPLISREDSIWTSAFVIGIMSPVIIASLLVLLAIVIGFFILKVISESDSSNSWSSSNGSTGHTPLRTGRLCTFVIKWVPYEKDIDWLESQYHTDYLTRPEDTSFQELEDEIKRRYGSAAIIKEYRIEQLYPN